MTQGRMVTNKLVYVSYIFSICIITIDILETMGWNGYIEALNFSSDSNFLVFDKCKNPILIFPIIASILLFSASCFITIYHFLFSPVFLIRFKTGITAGMSGITIGIIFLAMPFSTILYMQCNEDIHLKLISMYGVFAYIATFFAPAAFIGAGYYTTCGIVAILRSYAK